MANVDEKAKEYYRLGREQEDMDKAIEYFTEAIKTAPAWDGAYAIRGTTYKGKTEYDKAIADFNEAIRINPKDAYYYYLRGTVYAEKGDFNRTIADCTEAIRVDGIDDRLKDVSTIDEELKTLWALIYGERAEAYVNMKNYKQAITDYEAALLINPDSEDAERLHNNLVFCRKNAVRGFARFWLTFRRRIIIGGIIGAIIAILSLVSSNPFSQGISNGILTVIIIFVMFVVLGGIVGFILPFIFKVISLFTGKGK